MKNVQPPQILTDLYRDLRDRRLLLPALALAVALIAVPMALSSSAAPTDTTPSTAPEASEPGAETAAEAAVLTRQLGVTAYRKRLDRFNSKNPFHQQFTLPEVTSKVDQSSVTEPLATTGVTTSGGGSSSTSSTAEPTSASSTSPGGSTNTPPSSKPSGGSGGSTEPTLFVFQADLAIGPPGDLSRRKSVELGKFLPSETKAMIAFSGATQDLKHALFLVTDDVSSVTGDGECVPGPANCRLLKLKVGDEAELTYAPESDRTYKLKLFEIRLAPADVDAASKQGKRGSLSAFAAQG
ncbi:MAG TPA: hypothetical protein VN458_02155 [Solirubrobacterales bacterium]|nr:hypothetical protein [Solirubrobacterales bacterium]